MSQHSTRPTGRVVALLTPQPTTPQGAAGEARIRDTDLGVKLGYDRPESIRTLIKRNRDALEAMGTLLQSEAMIAIGKGATNAVTEFHLSQAQAVYLVSKARTKQATSLAILIAEVFAMFATGHLAPTSAQAEETLRQSFQRHAERSGVCPVEERAARAEALRGMKRRRKRQPRLAGLVGTRTPRP